MHRRPAGVLAAAALAVWVTLALPGPCLAQDELSEADRKRIEEFEQKFGKRLEGVEKTFEQLIGKLEKRFEKAVIRVERRFEDVLVDMEDNPRGKDLTKRSKVLFEKLDELDKQVKAFSESAKFLELPAPKCGGGKVR